MPLVAVLILRTIIIIVIPIISIAAAITGISIAIAVYPAIIMFNGSIVACRNQVGRATTMFSASFTPALKSYTGEYDIVRDYGFVTLRPCWRVRTVPIYNDPNLIR